MFSAAELAGFCVTGEQRFREALSAGPGPAWATYAEIEQARRSTCNRYRDWLALTDEYVLECRGHAAHRDVGEPGRIAELASRSGLGLGDLELIQLLCAGPESPTAERVQHALETGDEDGALAAWQESERLLKAVHDLRRDLITDRLGRIYRRFGVDALQQAMLYASQRGWWSVSMPADFALEAGQRLRNLAFFLSVCAYFELRIVEEPERWIVLADVCGRCGRQCRDRYMADGWDFEIVTERGPVTFGREAMTIYQTHAAVIHHMYAIDTVGAPWPVFECLGPRADPGGCRLLVYKDPAITPTEYFTSVGREPRLDPR
jgi:hypothetical protein